jgi:hypothetical protein
MYVCIAKTLPIFINKKSPIHTQQTLKNVGEQGAEGDIGT